MKRTGAVSILFLFLLMAVIAIGAMAVDLAMIEAARTDMRITADLASRGALVEYIESNSVDDARSRAQEVANMHHVAGKQVQLEVDDIIPGNSTKQPDDKYVFTAQATPFNSFRVNARLDQDSANGSLNTMFPNVHHTQAVNILQSATATETYLDIVLVLDRSGSMGWDLSGTSWQYPNGGGWEINYFDTPQDASRWVSLESAVQVFIDEMNRKEKKEHVAVVTYSSDYDIFSEHFNRWFSSTEVATDLTFTQSYDSVVNAVVARGDNPDTPIIGGTAISSGMDRARTLFENSPREAYAEKIMILLTDGQWNVGYDPVTSAEAAADEDIIIHTISFGAGAAQSVMEDVAEATGGVAYEAPGADELEEAFRKIAQSIGISFTE